MVVKGNYYTILGVSPEASEEEIKARYIKLSLEHHSDKGGDGEEIKKITNAYEILSNYHQRLKYDLGLLKNFYNTSAGEYIESEKWGVTYLPNEKIGDELVWKIAALLQEELKIKNLDEEELSKYGQNKPNIVLERGSFEEVKKIVVFCKQKLKGKKFLTAIENTRSYLETILNSFDDREDVNLIIEEDIMPSEELSIDPLLTKKELDEYDGHNEYDFYCEKVREEILKKTYKNRRERILKIKENFTKIVEPLKEKIKQRREQKRKLISLSMIFPKNTLTRQLNLKD